MTTLNYSLAFEKAKKLLQPWKWRSLTPIDRITVIKTFILSKFVHLFTTIPSPDHEFIKEINSFYLATCGIRNLTKEKGALSFKILIKEVLECWTYNVYTITETYLDDKTTQVN